ncbi:MAG: DUF393 domain-containing protein [Deltaproteobacteria bacterium]|nr:MAG: DUF393 domain-containing protein [Deltaproteobacteria bacterium]TMB22653.1 MAG: DUF393 domain-containing protein [Deltaproteobacteria bacterium]
MTQDLRPVLVYDGHCRFCLREARRLERWLGGQIRLESFRDAGVLERHPALTPEACEQAMQLVAADGRIWSGAAAAARALRLRPLLAPLGWLYEVPGLRQLFDRTYRLIARNRFRIAGTVCSEETCGLHQPREPPPRAHARDLFLRLLGVIFLVAFLSLLAQATLLFGRQGLLPAAEYLARMHGFLAAPTLFWIDASDHALRVAAVGGAVLSCGLVFNVAPRIALAACWLVYLSFVTIGQDFLSFQWDNLLLESAFFALFVTPGGFHPRNAPAPHPLAVFLMLWLLFRLHVESGAAKWLLGDPTWRDLTAMATYYETAPLSTWVGWYAHQMPLWAHKLCSLYVYVVELGLPFLVYGPALVRGGVFVAMLGMQVSILLTGNYAFFNYLTIALSLFLLDDGQLGRLAAFIGWRLGTPRRRTRVPTRTALLAGAVTILVPLSVIQFLPLVPPLRDLNRKLAPVRQVLNTYRSVNAYHLFAQMTLVRREVVLEGSADGVAWLPYEFRYKPGDPERPPAFVAPHQPRVDFQLWFLLLGGPPRERYFQNLLARCLTAPAVVAPLFSRDPFPTDPPQELRLAFYRYRFTDGAARRREGTWWVRELLGRSRPLTAGDFGR